MDVIATRVLTSVDDQGTSSDLVLIVYEPFNVRPGLWKCGFATEPPISETITYVAGVDFIHTLVTALRFARVYLETVGRSYRACWQGRSDCGLPEQTPNPKPLDSPSIHPPNDNGAPTNVLATRWVGYLNKSAGGGEIHLTVFKPFNTNGESWKCGFTFVPPDGTTPYYGIGADSIEALLECLALARAVYNAQVTRDHEREGDFLDCEDLPYKVGSSFWLNLASEPSTFRAATR